MENMFLGKSAVTKTLSLLLALTFSFYNVSFADTARVTVVKPAHDTLAVKSVAFTSSATADDLDEVETIVAKHIKEWLDRIKEEISGDEPWEQVVDSDKAWDALKSNYLSGNMSLTYGNITAAKDKVVEIFDQFRNVELTRTSGREHARFGSDEPYTVVEHEAINKAIAATIKELESAQINIREEQTKYGTFVVLPDGVYDANAKELNAPLDLVCHPGTAGTRKDYTAKGLAGVKMRFYIKESIFDKLSDDEKTTLARHEQMHILFGLGEKTISNDDLKKYGTEENYINHQEGCDIRPIMAKLGSAFHQAQILSDENKEAANAIKTYKQRLSLYKRIFAFGLVEEVKTWLKSYVDALTSNKTPLSLFSDFGIESITPLIVKNETLSTAKKAINQLRVDVVLKGGARGHFVNPAGTSTGVDERKMVGDLDKIVANVGKAFAEIKRKGLRADQITEIGALLYELDKNGEIGAEATLSVQGALAWAVAHQKGLREDEYIGVIAPDLKPTAETPRTKSQYNITNGGEHADNALDMQEFMIVASGNTAKEENKMCVEVDYQLGLVYQALGLKADTNDNGMGNMRGKEGGYKVEDLTLAKLSEIYTKADSYNIGNLNIAVLAKEGVGVHEFVLNCMMAAIKNAGYTPSASGAVGTVGISLDPATSAMLVDKDKPEAERRNDLYGYEGREIKSAELADIFASWVEKFPIISIEDGMSENDWDGWMSLIDKIGDKVLIIGDDLLVTQGKRFMKLIEEVKKRGWFDEVTGKVTKKLGILIKLNQNGFLTTGVNNPEEGYLGTLEVIRLAKSFGVEGVVSHRSNEAEAKENEVSIAYVANGTGARYLKSGDYVQPIRGVKEAALADRQYEDLVSANSDELIAAQIVDDSVKGEKIGNDYSVDVKGVYERFSEREGTNLVEVVTLTGEEISLDKVLPIVADRKYNVTVRSGALAITTGGKIVEDGNSGNAVLFRRGETFTVTGNSVRTFDGRVYKLEETGYTIKHASYEPVQFKVDYEKTEREKDVYATFEMVKKNLADLLQDKEIDLILPKEMFVGGNVSGEQKVLDDFFGKNVVNIVAYNTEIGLDAAAQAVSSSVAKGRTPVFAATNSDVDRINTPGNEGTLEKIKQARVLVVPDLNDLKDNGWFFVREVEAEAMLHAILTEEDVTAKSTLAEDVRMSLAQLTGRKISMNELYTLLPFASVSEQIKAAINATDISAWLNLVKKLLLSMPMEAYDPKSELDARRRLMWSA